MRVTCHSSYSSRFAGALLVISAGAVMMACGEVSKNPAAPSATSSSVSTASPVTATSITVQAKVDVCHRTKGTDAFVAISVAASALGAHIAHGDGLVGDPVPGQPGMIFGPRCTPVAGQITTITFADLLIDTALVSNYSESAFTVLAAPGNWEARTTYGVPAPSIQFWAAGGASVTGQVTVSANDGGLFRFVSVDLYSSVTTIPYLFSGIRNSATVFTVTGTVPNTFGDFATVQNPHSADLIDTLLITLTNAAPDCCDNPMGLDNIVVAR